MSNIMFCQTSPHKAFKRILLNINKLQDKKHESVKCRTLFEPSRRLQNRQNRRQEAPWACPITATQYRPTDLEAEVKPEMADEQPRESQAICGAPLRTGEAGTVG